MIILAMISPAGTSTALLNSIAFIHTGNKGLKYKLKASAI